MQEERFYRTVAPENGERLECDLVAASDSEKVTGAGSELAKELGSWGDNNGGLG